MSQTTDVVSQLCPACGLCCNGVLFGDVELQPTDNAALLRKLGLDLFRKGRKQCFSQPCACLDGRLCRIYDYRPDRCRTFECVLLKRVQKDQISASRALKAIAGARIAVENVLTLVRRLGNTEEHVPLNRRFAAIAALPIDLKRGGDFSKRRRELVPAVAKLTRRLERDFLPGGCVRQKGNVSSWGFVQCYKEQ